MGILAHHGPRVPSNGGFSLARSDGNIMRSTLRSRSEAEAFDELVLVPTAVHGQARPSCCTFWGSASRIFLVPAGARFQGNAQLKCEADGTEVATEREIAR